MALGAPGLPAIAGPVGLVSGGTDIVSVAGPSMRGDEATPMSPMESVIEIFTEIRDGINSLVQLALDEASGKELAGRNASIAAGDTDAPPPAGHEQSGGNMIDSLKDALSGLGDTGMSLLGITALIAGFLIFDALADTLAKGLAPILEFLGETLIPNIKELNEIIMSHPGGYFTLLGATGLIVTLDEVFGIRGSLNRLFTSISNFARTAFIDDIDFRTKIGKSFAGKINRAIYGTKSGRGGLIPNLNRFFTGLATSIRTTFFPEEPLKLLKSTASGWTRMVTRPITALGGPKGGGGIIARVGRVFSGIGNAIRGIFTAASATKALGVIKGITTSFGRTMARIGNVVTRTLGFISKISGLGAFLRLGLGFARAIPIVGQIIMVVQGLFGFVTGAIEGYKTGGILGAITGALTGLYDALIGNFLNMIFDIVGFIFKKLGLEGLGNFFSNLDFSFESIKSAVIGVIDMVRYAFHQIVTGLKMMANGIITAVNYIPGIEFDKFEYTEFKPMKVDAPAEPPPEPDIMPGTSDSDVNLAKIEEMRTGFNKNDVMDNFVMPDTSTFAQSGGATFAPITQTAGDVFNTNASVSMPMSSTHTDETAKILSESVYN